MSKIFMEFEDEKLCHIVECDNGQIYYVDSRKTLDKGYETMVFKCELTKDNFKIEWNELYVEYYGSISQMAFRHSHIVNNLEEVLGGNI